MRNEKPETSPTGQLANWQENYERQATSYEISEFRFHVKLQNLAAPCRKRLPEHFEKVHRSFAKSTKNFS